MPRIRILKQGKLERYNLYERKYATEKAVRTLRTVLKKPGQRGNKPILRSLKAHDPTNRLRKLPEMLAGDIKKTFPAKYRALWPEQDEFVRTSLVTDLLAKAFSSNLPAAEMERLIAIVKDISQVRFPTKWSGFKFKNPTSGIDGFPVMQHPTSKGEGIWDRSVSGGSSAHSYLDNARVKVAIDTINSFAQTDTGGVVTLKPNVTMDTVVKAIIREVGVFTLNHFTGPATAGNLETDASATEKLEQTAAREFWKDKMVELGAPRVSQPVGVVIPKLNLSTLSDRPWEPELHPGQISPRRETGLDFMDVSIFK